MPLTVRQIHSMQSLQRHAPEMKEIQKKYKGDRQKQNEELMKFYRENNINPAASCLPMLAQIPVFISLYFVLRHFAKHPPCPAHRTRRSSASTAATSRGSGTLRAEHRRPRHAHWSGYLLLVIYAASQISSTYFMSTTMDKTQRTPDDGPAARSSSSFLLNFPVGLVIYWVTTNLWTVGPGARHAAARAARRRRRRSSAARRGRRRAAEPDAGNGAQAPTARRRRRAGAAAAAAAAQVKRKKKGGARR